MSVQNDEGKSQKTLWIILGVLVFLILAIVAFLIFKTSRSRQQAFAPSYASLATPTMSTVVSTPTPIPAVRTTHWKVLEPDVDTIREYGFSYTVYTFYNTGDPSWIIRASCRCPKCPAPEVGHEYYESEFRSDLLVPIEGIESPLQRFQKR